MEKTYLRSDVARGISDGVDRKGEQIIGYSVITKGMARGHNLEIDDETLDQVVELGNKTRTGVKSRFGHPTMSSESLGTFLGRSRHFRRDGDVVRADLLVDPTAHDTPHGDLAGYVLSLAESDPSAFGSSIVFSGEAEVRMDDDGKPLRDKKSGEPLPPLARVEKLYASDVVDDPAANSGMFAVQFMTPDCELSARASEFLDRFLTDSRAVEKALAFLLRYRAEHETEGEDMSKKKADNPEIPAVEPEALEAETERYTEEELNVLMDVAKDRAIQEERQRIVEIQTSAFAGQDAIVQKAIAEGLSVSEAQALFIRDRKQRDGKELAALRTDPAPDLGPNVEVEVEAKKGEEKDPEKAWDADADLRKEFRGDKGAYLAYIKAMGAGTHRERVVEEE